MARVRQRDTRAEIELRKILHARRLRYRPHAALLTKPRPIVDIVFPRSRVAVFVDGCFWHGCPEHGSWPKSNADFWREKIETNRVRDADTDLRLRALGWEVIRVWTHEDASNAAERIGRTIAAQNSRGAH